MAVHPGHLRHSRTFRGDWRKDEFFHLAAKRCGKRNGTVPFLPPSGFRVNFTYCESLFSDLDFAMPECSQRPMRGLRVPSTIHPPITYSCRKAIPIALTKPNLKRDVITKFSFGAFRRPIAPAKPKPDSALHSPKAPNSPHIHF